MEKQRAIKEANAIMEQLSASIAKAEADAATALEVQKELTAKLNESNAALAKGSPEDVRQRLRAATTTLRRRLDAGLPLRTLVWDRTHERYAVATLVLDKGAAVDRAAGGATPGSRASHVDSPIARPASFE